MCFFDAVNTYLLYRKHQSDLFVSLQLTENVLVSLEHHAYLTTSPITIRATTSTAALGDVALT